MEKIFQGDERDELYLILLRLTIKLYLMLLRLTIELDSGGDDLDRSN